MGRHSQVSSKMRSLSFLIVAVVACVVIEASPKVRNKSFKTIKRRLIGNLKDRFKNINKKEEEVLEAPTENEPMEDSMPMLTSTTSKFAELFGFGIAEKVSMDFGAMEQYLLTMQMNEHTSALVQQIVDANPCVDSLVEYNAMLGAGAKLLIDNGPSIERLLVTLSSLRGERNMTVLLKKSSSIMHDLDQVIPLFGFLTCQYDPKVAVASLRETALVLDKMSHIDNVPFLVFTTPIREGLRWSARLTEALSNWVDHFFRYAELHDCYTSEDGLGDMIQQVVYNMKDVAKILGALGHYETAKEIRSYTIFVKSLKDSLKDLPEYTFPGFCGLDTFAKVGDILDDMTSIIGEIGLGRLSSSLGVSFRLDLLPQ